MPVTRTQIDALLALFEGPMRKVFEQIINDARGRANISRMVLAMEAGNFDELLAASGVRESMWSSMSEQIRGAYAGGGKFTLNNDLPKKAMFDFDMNNPRAEAWLKKRSYQLIKGDLQPEQIGAIQTVLHNGMVKGANPRETALDIVGRVSPATGRRQGGVLGLTKYQATFVTNAADELDNLNSNYLTRRLRDKRYDAAVKKAIADGKPLPASLKQTIIGRYEDKLLKMRGDTIARTETLAAINASADEALNQVIEEGLAPPNAVKRIWRHGGYSADQRPGHVDMGSMKQERGPGEYFINPVTGVPLLRPGEGPASEIINCRCYLEHKIDFIAVEKANMPPPLAPTPPVLAPKPKRPSTPRKPKVLVDPNALPLNLALTAEASISTTEEIIAALKTIPGAQARVEMVETLIRRHNLGTVYVPEMSTMNEPGMFAKIRAHSRKVWKNSMDTDALKKKWWANARNTNGMAHPWWSFVLIKSKGSVPDTLKATLANIRTAFQTHNNWSASGSNAIGTWMHEMGHVFHFKAEKLNVTVKPYGKLKLSGFNLASSLTTYGRKDDYEYIAEHFVFWLVDRHLLSLKRPDVTKVIDDFMEALINATP